MAGAKVEDTALPQVPEAAAAEPLPGRPALLQDHRVGRGHVEGLVIHLGFLDLE